MLNDLNNQSAAQVPPINNDFFSPDVFSNDIDQPLEESAALPVGASLPDTGFDQHVVTDDVRENRYFFNPWMVCETRSLAAPVGYQFLPNGQIITIKAVTERRTPPDYSYQSIPTPYDRGGNPYLNTRQPGHIANDLILNYSAHGVTELTALRGIDDDAAIAGISKKVLGENVPVKVDIFFEDHPCPVLPLWMERIEENVEAALNHYQDSPDAVKMVTNVAKNIRDAFSRARTAAKNLTDAAQSRMLQPNAANKKFDALERRAFIALGMDIPDQLPTVTASANSRAEKLEDAFLNLAQSNVRQNQVVEAQMEPEVVAALLDTIKTQGEQLSESMSFMREMREELAGMKKLMPVAGAVITPSEGQTSASSRELIAEIENAAQSLTPAAKGKGK